MTLQVDVLQKTFQRQHAYSTCSQCAHHPIRAAIQSNFILFHCPSKIERIG